MLDDALNADIRTCVRDLDRWRHRTEKGDRGGSERFDVGAAREEGVLCVRVLKQRQQQRLGRENLMLPTARIGETAPERLLAFAAKHPVLSSYLLLT
jgi:hypothetical protein